MIGVFAWLDEWIDARAAPDFVGTDTYPPGVMVFIALLVLSTMGAREIARIFRAKGVEIGSGIAMFIAMLGLVTIAFGRPLISESLLMAGGFTSVIVAYVAGLLYALRHKEVNGSIAIGSGVLFIHVYMGLMLGFMLLIRQEHSIWILIWVLASVKSCDIGAYFTGTTIGKHKLIPWLSPGKTWEGLVGGMITSGVVAGVGALLLERNGILAPSVGIAVVMGVIMGGLGQCGDLAASLLKRDAGVKDAGASLPGFGGVLDIIDSPALVLPFAYWALVLIQDMGLSATPAL
jgi:phosphatidate cytidylyltransferase